MAQGVHFGDWCHAADIAVVPGIRTLGHTGASCWFNVYDAQVWLFALDFIFDEGQEHTGEVAAAADTADDDIGVKARLLHLLLSLLADYGLMKQDGIDNAANGIVGILAAEGVFYSFADGDG